MHYTSEDFARTQKYLDRLLDEGIKPNAQKIAPIFLSQDVALLFFNPGPGSDVRKAAKLMGWKGREIEVRRMPEAMAQMLAASLMPGDPAAGWLLHRRQGRVFVVMESGTLCVNHVPGEGFSIEPGTTDRDWMV